MPSRPLTELLAGFEDLDVEFKRDTSALKKIVLEVIAFANRRGGTVVVGVEDDTGAVVGVDDPQKIEQQLAQAIYDGTKPRLAPSISISTDPDTGLYVVIIDVAYWQGPDPVTDKDGNVYERVSSQTRKQAPERVAEMRRDRQVNMGFDQQPDFTSGVDALDLDAARDRFRDHGIELDDGKLRSFEIVVDANGETFPTLGGLLLFGREPQKRLPDAVFKFARFDGTDKAGGMREKSQFETGSMLDAIDAMVDFIAQYNKVASRIPKGSRTRHDVRFWDELVIREATHNAVAHADYSVAGSKFYLHIFDDRLVIQNPGGWMPGKGVEDLRAGQSTTRNRSIAKQMEALDLIEEHGTFWTKAKRAHERDGYPLPEFEELGSALRTIIPVHPYALSDAAPAEVPAPRRRMSREERMSQVREALGTGDASTAVIAERVHLGERQVQRLLGEMREAGAVEDNGEPDRSPALRWRLRTPT